MTENNFDRPVNNFSQPPRDEFRGSALARLQERLGIGRREQIIIIGVGVLAIVTGILLFFRPQPETPPPAAFTPLEQHQGSIQITFTGDTTVPLDTVEVFSVQESISQEQLLQTFAARLEMQKAEYSLSGNTYLSSAGDATLTFAAGNQGFIYTHTQPLASDIGTVEFTTARVVAADFLDRLGYTTSDLTLIESKTQYLGLSTQNNEDLISVQPEDAQIIRLVYERQMNGLPIAFAASAVENFTLDIIQNEVFRATLPNTFFSSVSTGKYEVVSVEQALDTMRTGNFTIIGTTARVQKENDYIELRLDTQSLQYRFDPTTQILFPVFRFSGTAITASYQELPITVVTEAIHVQEVENNATVETTPQNTAHPE